jgi:deoxycytidylate deaminase
MIINAGIRRVVIQETYPDELAEAMFREAGIRVDVMGD